MAVTPLRITETQIGKAALRILAAHSTGTMTITAIKAELPHHLPLSSADKAGSPTRIHEEVWEQQVRNLVSHRSTPGNIIHEGLADYKPRWLTITDAGRKYIKA